MARNCTAQNLSDPWPVVTYVGLPMKKGEWRYRGNSSLKEWRPKQESDESGFERVIVERLEAAEFLMGEISIDCIMECFLLAARAVEFESTGEDRLERIDQSNFAEREP